MTPWISFSGIQTQNLLAYKNFGRATRLISRDMVKKAMSDERLTTIKELRKYKVRQHKGA